MAKRAKSLAQLKLDVKRSGWPWPMSPNDERALLNGCFPDFKAAERLRKFFEDFLVIPQDGGGIKPFVLLDWWFERVLAPLFGWKRHDGRRRFDKGFVTTAKKSAKSTIASGLPLYMMLADNEEEAECYSAATDRDQAGIIHKKTARMARLCPELSNVLAFVDSQKRIIHEETGSFYEAISSDADSAEGKNPHLLLADELHVWKDRQFFNSLMYGDIARSQPLFLMLTTAGEDRDGIGYEEYEFAKDLLDPANEFYSESHFAYIAEATEEKQWDDPLAWLQANPSLACGAIGSVEKLRSKCDEAKQSPRKQREFIRYICNRWVDCIPDIWISADAWAACSGDAPDRAGETCWGGLDLSKSVDLTALCLLFKDGPMLDFRWTFFMPEDRLKELEDRDRAPYRDWAKDGFIIPTSGATVDYAVIRSIISGVTLDAQGRPNDYREPDCLANKHRIACIGFDPWNSSKLITELGEYDGISMLEFRQGFASMNAPCKEFERAMAERNIMHGGNPVAKWMFGHCATDTDPAGNVKLSKSKSTNKIDGCVAAVMALAASTAKPQEAEPRIWSF
jgi:phage terminase large subunit-like protein